MGERLNLAFVFEGGREARLADVRAGRAPGEFFLGALELESAGHAVRVFDTEHWSPAPGGLSVLCSWLPPALWPNRVKAEMLARLRTGLTELNTAEVVVAGSSGTALALAILRSTGALVPDVVGIHCTLLNLAPNAWQRRTMRALFRRHWTLLYGEGELAGMAMRFGIPPDRMGVNQFGVDTSFWTPAEGVPMRGDACFSVGNDGRRDYATLCRAASRIPGRVRILTRHRLPDALPPNVEWIAGNWRQPGLSDAGLREAYRQADCVVVPLLESDQPSGQSVTLQAMACGTPVILTRTRGLWSSSMVRDGENALLVPPGDPVALAEAVGRLRTDAPLRARLVAEGLKTVRERADIRGYATRLEQVCQRVAKQRNTGA